MDERFFLSLSCVPYAIASAYAFYAFGAKSFRRNHLNLAFIVVAFVLHSIFLFMRGEEIGHCPLTNPFETIVFLSWAIALNYLLIGPPFHISLLGAFSAPLILALNLFAMLTPTLDRPSGPQPQAGWLLELHAGVSVLAYGTLGIAAIAAVMFLISNHYLKLRLLHPIVSRLPPVGKLDVVSQRVMVLGFLLLAVGMAAGFLSPTIKHDTVKATWSVMVLLGYALLLLARLKSWFSPSRFAWACVSLYLFILLTFWAINSVSLLHHSRL